MLIKITVVKLMKYNVNNEILKRDSSSFVTKKICITCVIVLYSTSNLPNDILSNKQ